MNRARRQLLANWLWLALALCASGAVFATLKRPSSAETLVRSQHLLTAFQLDDVTRVSVEKDGKRFVVGRQVVKQGAEPRADEGDSERWQWIEPFQGTAEEAAVDELLRTVEFATWLRQLEPGDVDRTQLGFDSPSVVIGVEMGEIHYRIRLGAEAPSPSGSRYLEINGDGVPQKGVYVVSESTAHDLDVDPGDLQIRQLIPYAGSALVGIRARIKDQDVRLKRRDRSAFQFEGAFGGARVGREAMDRILLGFARSDLEPFVPLERAQALQNAAAEHGTNLLRLTLQPRMASAGDAELVLGAPCPDDAKKVLAVRSTPRPSAGCVAPSTLLELFARPTALVDRAAFQVRLDEVERIVVREGERSLELVRVGDGFALRAPVEGDVEREAGEQRVREMITLRGDVTDAKDAGTLLPSFATVTITKASAEPEGEEEVVELSRTSEGAVYAKRRADNVLLRLAPSALSAFAVDTLLLRSRTLWDVPAADVKRVEWSIAGEHWSLNQNNPNEFELQAAAGDAKTAATRYVADASLALQLLEELRRPVVQKWVAEDTDDRFGFGRALSSVTVTTSDAVHELTIGDAVQQGAYAREQGKSGVFVLAAPFLQSLRTLLIDRSGFALDREHCVRFTLDAHGQSTTLRRIGDEFEQEAGDRELSRADSSELVEALTLVRPEAAIATQSHAEHGFDKPLLRVRFESDGDAPDRGQGFSVGGRGFLDNLAVYYARKTADGPVYAIAAQQIDALLSHL